MKSRCVLLATLLAATAAWAQVVPATNGHAGLAVSGALHYDVRYSQTAEFYGSGGTTQTAILSGDATYSNAAPARPFSLTYSGGDMWNFSGSNGETGIFQHLAVSQGVIRHAWSASVSDNVSYAPQTPITGFSGIPGVGGLPGLPIAPVQTILTSNTRSVFNVVTPSFTHRINRATSFSASGSYSILRFPDGNGLGIDTMEIGPQLTRRLNSRNSIFAQYSYTRVSYPGYTITMELQSAMGGYQRTWNRRLKTSVSAGPQWVQGSSSSGIPSSTNLAINANATYEAKPMIYSVVYSQAASGGSGVSSQFGTRNKDLNGTLSRQYGKDLSVSATAAYMRTQGLSQTGVTDAMDASTSVTRRLGRSFNASASYSIVRQTTSAQLTSNALTGHYQVIGFGIGYSPRDKRFKK